MNNHIVYGPKLERKTNLNLGQLLFMALRKHGDKILQVDYNSNEEQSAAAILKQAIYLARWLQKHGVGPGERVAIISENNLEYAVAMVAVFFNGATLAPVSCHYKKDELRHALGLSCPKIVFCSNKLHDLISDVCEELKVHKVVVLNKQLSVNSTAASFVTICAGGYDSDNIGSFVPVSNVNVQTNVATILCSSGTTGLPKGVECSQDNILAYVDILEMMKLPLTQEQCKSIGSNALVGIAPFFHSFGFMMMLLSLMAGFTFVILHPFDTLKFMKCITSYKVELLNLPPMVLLRLLEHPDREKFDWSAVREIRTGAAPLNIQMENKLRKYFKVAKIGQVYGMTETTLTVMINPIDAPKAGSVGKLVPGMQAKSVAEDGVTTLSTYQKGELYLKGPLIMRGYANDIEATRACIDSDGWLRSGDVAYYDEDGYFFIVDRLKELIKYNGYQVAPAELEGVLMQHEAVADVAVVGLKDDCRGELPTAFVAVKPNYEGQLLEKGLIDFVAERVSSYKHLRGGIRLVSAIPRNAAGKILRRLLKESLNQRMQ